MTGTSAGEGRSDAAAPGQGVPGRRETPRWMRFVMAGAALLAVLLLAGALGMFVRAQQGGTAAQPETTSVDVGFAQDMSVHHRQAILMAGLARDRSDDPAIRSLAFDIETNQLEQVGRMQGWLSLWNQAPLPTGRYMTWMESGSSGEHGGSHEAGTGGDDNNGGHGGMTTMPGMASSAELDRLRAARGEQLDVLFLQLMLRHHQGGVPMAAYAAQHAETAQVRNLADKIVIAQGSEADYLKKLLAQHGAQPLPPPS